MPEKWSALFTVMFGAIFVLGGGVAVIIGQWPMGLAAIVLGAAMGGFMVPSLTDSHVVTWQDVRSYVGHCEDPDRMG